MKSRPWGRKTLLRAPIAREAFRTHPVRVCTFVPAFTLPLHRLPLPPQSNRHPAAAVIHNGLSTEKLSTSLPAALCKTFSPSRLRTRIYNISFARRPLPGRVRAAPEKSPRRCGTVSRAAVRRVGGGRRQRRTPPRAVPNHAACVPNHCVQRRKCTGPTPPLPVCSPRGNLPTASPPPVDGRSAERKGGSAQGNPRSCPCVLPATACLRPCPRPLMGEALCVLPAPACLRPCTLPADGRSAERRVGEGEGKGGRPLAQCPALSLPTAEPPRAATRTCPPTPPPPPPKWAPRLRRREGKRPNGAPTHHNAHTPNAARKRYLHNSRTMTQRRTKRCAQFVIFVFTPCKLLHNFSTVLHRSPRNVPKRAQIAARRPDFPCFTARFPNVLPESHRAKHPRTAPVLPPKNAPLRAYAKPRPHLRVRGTRQHAMTCAFFTFSARYERIGGARIANFCPAEG